MDQRIDGAGGKEPEGQAPQQLRDQHGLVGIHGVVGQALLGPARDKGQDGDVRDLGAGAAGGGH